MEPLQKYLPFKLSAQTLMALRFFSILPIPMFSFEQNGHHQVKGLNDAAPGYPLAGLIIAAPLAVLWYFTSQMMTPLLAASITIALGMLITGALHEDGLSDCFDGLGGGSDKDRVLEIMRDSAIGTFGASALLISVIVRITALASLGPLHGALALLFAHSLARATISIAIHGEQYARPTGTADLVSQGIDLATFIKTIVIAQIVVIILIFITGDFEAIWAIPIGIAAAWLFLRWMVFRIDGYTGDGLGAMEQFAEIAILISLAVMWS